MKRTIKISTACNKDVDEFTVSTNCPMGAGLEGKRVFISRNPNLTGSFILREYDDKSQVGRPFHFTVAEHKNNQRRNMFSF